jgi:osmoprotectant transport system ATP-binding protein
MIRFDGVSKHYPDGTIAVNELTLEAPTGQITVLVGPSGCGKTTSLRMVNRMIEPTSGRIWIDDQDTASMDASQLRRGIGYVIQRVGLFPHQTVRTNVATVAQLLGWDRRRTRERVDELLALVGLDPGQFGDRYPHQLSGGQQQRVGVARALVADPPVLLMDEPFGAVDPVVRVRLQDEFVALQQRIGTTVLFVTHDIEEAVRLGDMVGVFQQGGRLAQYDTPARVLGAPADDFVADFVGADRGLRRLAVTSIDDSDLQHPPVVDVGDSLADARAALEAANARWAVVLDRAGDLRGWLALDRTAEGSGTVGDRSRRMEAWVARDASLKDALAQMLQHDAGWVAVLDGSRFCGVLTPGTLHEALRRSVGADDRGVAPSTVHVDAAGPLRT